MHYNGINAEIARYCPGELKVHSNNSLPPRQILGYVNVTAVWLEQYVQRSWGRRELPCWRTGSLMWLGSNKFSTHWSKLFESNFHILIKYAILNTGIRSLSQWFFLIESQKWIIKVHIRYKNDSLNIVNNNIETQNKWLATRKMWNKLWNVHKLKCFETISKCDSNVYFQYMKWKKVQIILTVQSQLYSICIHVKYPKIYHIITNDYSDMLSL